MKSLLTEFFNRLPALLASVQDGESSPAQSLRRRAVYAGFNRLIGLAIPFTTRNHFRVVELRSGYLKATIPLRGNRNHVGSMYAGAMFLLAEIPGGVMALFEFGSAYFPLLKELTITYLQLAKTDLTVEFSMPADELARIRRVADAEGKCDFSLHAELLDTRGTAVARTVGHYQLRRAAVRS
jgi:acyl-coenzyme A thioesterase PaaI-like protein